MLRLLSFFFLLLISSASYSQSNIEKVVKQLRSSNAVTSIIYKESRDPHTKKLEEEKTLITFDNQSYDNLILEAMRKDRVDAVEYKEIVNPYSAVYKIEFQNGKTETIYTLMSPCTLSISIITDD